MLFALPRNFELLGVGFYLVFSQYNSLPRILRSSAHYKKRSMELRFGAAFEKNAASKSCLSCVLQKRSSTWLFELRFFSNAAPPVLKPHLKWFKPQLWVYWKAKKKKKRGLKLALRLLNAAPTFTELRLIKRSFNSYGAAFYETQL